MQLEFEFGAVNKACRGTHYSTMPLRGDDRTCAEHAIKCHIGPSTWLNTVRNALWTTAQAPRIKSIVRNISCDFRAFKLQVQCFRLSVPPQYWYSCNRQDGSPSSDVQGRARAQVRQQLGGHTNRGKWLKPHVLWKRFRRMSHCS